MKVNLQLAKKLKLRKYREKLGLYLVEGFHLIEEALKTEKVETLLFSEKVAVQKLINQIEKLNVPSIQISGRDAKSLSETETTQGVFAVIVERQNKLADFLSSKKTGVLVYCHGIQDPGNLGTIVRTADAAGIEGVILSKGCVDVFNPKVLRSAMGSTFHLPVVLKGTVETLKLLKTKGYKVVATSVRAKVSCFEADYGNKVVLVFGNEAAGIPAQIAALADFEVRIPIFGKAESLNVASAASIVIYEAVIKKWKNN